MKRFAGGDNHGKDDHGKDKGWGGGGGDWSGGGGDWSGGGGDWSGGGNNWNGGGDHGSAPSLVPCCFARTSAKCPCRMLFVVEAIQASGPLQAMMQGFIASLVTAAA